MHPGKRTIMWSGRKFRLRRDLHAVEKTGEQQIAAVIPIGETVEVVRGPYQSFVREVEVALRDRRFTVFATDLEAAGDEVAGRQVRG